ncbi:PfaD family polyunsaturated fatty acid/polyketide biosynthesis protein [Frankia sp. Ag45/Mut15]|uniref:PfaD family polyunsaturated fatty acid/polyketide biosynthesis protein n=1 Tax=Frankia umida TaxID=573489 RepID=A0ABT0JZ91_9ACTN|nr:PfaD family polyunsaturated fatty acid/polyketide biosynthesis protein [Frankia umida]MCK9876816.1 PfaD family polyunsaturated fatty acid/polyketide biosynthesis protein [Frankia umida]
MVTMTSPQPVPAQTVSALPQTAPAVPQSPSALPRYASSPPRTGVTGQAYRDLLALDAPCYVLREGTRVRTSGDQADVARVVAAGGQVLAAAGPRPATALGDGAFRAAHGVRYAYMAGAMANGIASAPMVAALARAGFLASFGAAGVLPARIDEALAAIVRDAAGAPFACNLIHSPSEAALEAATIDACLRHGVTTLEASAFVEPTAQLVRYRLAGLRRGRDGRVEATHRVVGKVSRAEVAERFLRPAPEALVRDLLAAGVVTADQAALAREVPLADDLSAEADSGGHTDRRPLTVLLPELLALAERLRREQGARHAVRVGAAGGLGTPAAVAAAFALGAAYVVTGSVNQATVEADQSAITKRLLGATGVADTAMAPSADMFELGVEVQVLRRGTLFPGRARTLYELYRAHDGVDALPADVRANLEAKVFRRSLDDVWADCVEFFTRRDPDQIIRAQGDPRRRMALIFRWYLGRSSGWSIAGEPDRAADYQVWCGPAMGAFNSWVAGTYLAEVGNRQVADVAAHLMTGAAFHERAAALRAAGARLPASATTYIPTAPLLGQG